MLLEVKAYPNSGRFELSFKGGWVARLASPPEKGKANAELLRELRKILGCPLRLVRGVSGRRKLLELGMDEDEFKARADAYLKGKGPRKGA